MIVPVDFILSLPIVKRVLCLYILISYFKTARKRRGRTFWILGMSDLPRNFITNLWIVIHTLATYITDQCENPWELPATHVMHSSTASTVWEVRVFAQKLFGIHDHLQRLVHQVTRIYNILCDCKYQSYSLKNQPQPNASMQWSYFRFENVSSWDASIKGIGLGGVAAFNRVKSHGR